MPAIGRTGYCCVVVAADLVVLKYLCKYVACDRAGIVAALPDGSWWLGFVPVLHSALSSKATTNSAAGTPVGLAAQSLVTTWLRPK